MVRLRLRLWLGLRLWLHLRLRLRLWLVLGPRVRGRRRAAAPGWTVLRAPCDPPRDPLCGF